MNIKIEYKIHQLIMTDLIIVNVSYVVNLKTLKCSKLKKLSLMCFELICSMKIILIHIYNCTVSKQKLVGAFLVQNSLLDMFVGW